MVPGIENNFKPQTVNEVLLLERIAELKRIFWKSGGGSFEYETDPNQTTVTMRAMVPTITLPLAASVHVDEASIPDTLKITGQSFNGELSLGFANYVSRKALARMTTGGAARMLEDLHYKVIHQLARVVKEAG